MRKWIKLVEEAVGGVVLYHGSRYELETNQFHPRSNGFIFLADDVNHAKIYGNFVYRCKVNLGKIAELTYSSPVKTMIVNKFSKEYPNIGELIEIGELWKRKSLEKQVLSELFLSYDSVEMPDTHTESYDDDDAADFGTSYVVMDGKRVFIEREE